MIQTSLIIEVEVVYDTDDTQIIEVNIKANGSCEKIDKRAIRKDNSLERYLLDVNMDSLTWDKKENSDVQFTARPNRCRERLGFKKGNQDERKVVHRFH